MPLDRGKPPTVVQVNCEENKSYLINYLASFAEHLPSGNELEDGCDDLYNNRIQNISNSLLVPLHSQNEHAFGGIHLHCFLGGGSCMGIESAEPKPATAYWCRASSSLSQIISPLVFSLQLFNIWWLQSNVWRGWGFHLKAWAAVESGVQRSMASYCLFRYQRTQKTRS